MKTRSGAAGRRCGTSPPCQGKPYRGAAGRLASLNPDAAGTPGFLRVMRISDRKRATAQAAASATTVGVRQETNGPGSNAGSRALPMAMSTLRTKRTRPMRLTGEPAKRARNPASSSAANSPSRGASRSARACSFASRVAAAKRFHGQAARQSSQP